MSSRYALKKRTPGRHYVWVYQGSPDAIGGYESSGYRYEKWNFQIKGGRVEIDQNDIPVSIGVHPPGARPEATANKSRIKVGDFCLMSVSKQRKADIDEYGHDGDTGQYYADEIDARIIKKTGGQDLLRGIKGLHRHHVDVEEYTEHGAEHGVTEFDRP